MRSVPADTSWAASSAAGSGQNQESPGNVGHLQELDPGGDAAEPHIPQPPLSLWGQASPCPEGTRGQDTPEAPPAQVCSAANPSLSPQILITSFFLNIYFSSLDMHIFLIPMFFQLKQVPGSPTLLSAGTKVHLRVTRPLQPPPTPLHHRTAKPNPTVGRTRTPALPQACPGVTENPRARSSISSESGPGQRGWAGSGPRGPASRGRGPWSNPKPQQNIPAGPSSAPR